MKHERTIGSKGNGLWGMKGEQLPAYIQHVYNDLVEGGEPTGSPTYRKAVGIVENWAEGHDGKGNKVKPETQTKAAAAIAEWNKLRAKAKIQEAMHVPTSANGPLLGEEIETGDLSSILEAPPKTDAEDAKDGGADETTEDMPSVYCVKCKAKRTPTAAKKCPNCGTDLSTAVAAAKKVQEAVLEAVLSAADRKKRPSSAFAIPESRGYPIHDLSHAQNALARCSGKPEESRVKTAVYKRYPQLKPTAKKKAA